MEKKTDVPATLATFIGDSEALSSDLLLEAFHKTAFDECRTAAALLLATGRALAYGNVPLSTAVGLLIEQYQASMKARRPLADTDALTPTEPPAHLRTWLQNLKN